jgi:phenylacetate-CoA ligase
MNDDVLVTEFIADGEIVASGERGEIVGTTLINRAMPLIRYTVGDVGRPVDEHCACGVTLSLMKILEGRTRDLLTATDGRIIDPAVLNDPITILENFEQIRQFQVIQEQRDKLIIRLVVTEGFLRDAKVLERAERKIQRLFGADMQVEFQIVEKIPRDPSGKLRAIMSRVPVNIGFTSPHI